MKKSDSWQNIDVGYAVDDRGNSLGILADGNMLLDKSLKTVGKICPMTKSFPT